MIKFLFHKRNYDSYLILSIDTNDNILGKPETLQIYSLASKDGDYDPLVMKIPQRLKYDVSNKFLYQFIEKLKKKNKSESNYEMILHTAKAHNNQCYE